MNMAVARAGMDKDWGIGTGVCFDPADDSLPSRIRRATASATEVRMGGGNYPVMSSAGSGNHGIAAIIPLAVAAESLGSSELQLAKALALSHLICAFIKAHTGRLSPICGCAVASGAGAAAGLVMLRGGTREQAERASVSLITSLIGMLCDGGKENCSLKVGTAAAEAWAAASLSLYGGGIRVEQGLISPSLAETGKIIKEVTGGVYKRLDPHMADIMLRRGVSSSAPEK